MPFLEDVVSGYVNAGVGQFATNIFIGSAHNVPDGDGPYLSIVQTQGMRDEELHNDVDSPAYQLPSAQVTVRAKSYLACRTMARNAYNASRATNTFINGVWYRRIRPEQEPFDRGLDAKARVVMSFNLMAEKGPS